MESYTSLIKEQNGFNFDDNKIEVESVEVDELSSTFFIDLKIDKALTLQEYLKFLDSNKIIFGNLHYGYSIKLRYSSVNLNSNDYLEYYKYTLNDLVMESPFYKTFLDFNVSIDNNVISIKVDRITKIYNEFSLKLEKELEKYALNLHVCLVESKDVINAEEIQKEIINKNKQELELKQQQAQEAARKAQLEVKSDNGVKTFIKKIKEVTPIKEVPLTQEGIFEYQNRFGETVFLIEGEVFFQEIRDFPKSSLVTLKISDNTDSIVVKKWVRSEEEMKNIKEFTNGTIVKVLGKAEYDTYIRNVVITASTISYVGENEKKSRVDTAPVKRVELHVHTKMTNLDGLNEPSEYVKTAMSWGHKAMAFTDRNGVYAIPDINHATEKKDFKAIYGCELNYVDDTKLSITYEPDDIDLKEASYVVFDIETTGFSTTYDRIIEIAAFKITGGIITDSIDTFVNPEMPIPEIITSLTSINDDMVKGAPKIKEALTRFLEFAKGSILVAHNASFDIGHIYANMERLNIEGEKFRAIDTLNLSRALYGDVLNKFNLEAISKFFKIKQEHHHRADDDTKVTAECFLCMLNDLYKKKIYNYKDINSIININEICKHIIPSRINVLAKNQVGYKNLFKIVSDALTVHLSKKAIVLKSVIDKYREGILVTSSCSFGEVFEMALNKGLDTLREAISYYDIIEVQPLGCYAYLFDNMIDGEDRVIKTITKIIKEAKDLGKIVVATSDCYYIDKEQRKYRDILIGSPQVGGGLHDLARYKTAPFSHLRTTNEMLDEMSFVGKDLAYEIVVTNTNLVADMIDNIKCFHDEMFVPADDEFKDTLGVLSMIDEMKKVVYDNVEKLYGSKPHKLVSARVERELGSIIKSGYYSTYFMSYLLVKKSLEDGYLVGSRGSVGSSLVATMMNITEVNPLPPHYRCPECKFVAFKFSDEDKDKIETPEEAALEEILNSVESGYDLPDMKCPICGAQMIKDGHDIPFETFLGFDGDKVPDIDLNFSGEYQSQAHEYVRFLMGKENAFRGGTVGTIADKNAYGYVKAYAEKKGLDLRTAEIDRISSKLVGIKRSTGQHPGGIVVVPKRIDIYDVTPIQYPADDNTNAWRTTHFDYHAFENNLLKLDILGHDDPTLIRYYMDIVHEHQSEFPFSNPQDIPVDDKKVYELFGGTKVINVREEDIMSKVASYAVPEFGTNFVRQMLMDTLPTTFAQLVKISGLSHGTDVWLNNAQSLVLGKTEFGTIPFNDVIGCRDDIMVYLLYQNLDPLKAFKIMEFVRKGKVAKDPETWKSYKDYMHEKKVPEWYIWSCEQIKYMFPKAHATAYVLMALRIAWFKVYKPALFYSGYFSKRAKAYDVETFAKGPEAIRSKIRELSAKTGATAKDEDTITALGVALEATVRGVKFLPIDINKSDSLNFLIEGPLDFGALRMPFVALDGLGDAVAVDIKERRDEKAFTSKKDVAKRTRINQTLFDKLTVLGAFDDLEDEEPEVSQGIFAFL